MPVQHPSHPLPACGDRPAGEVAGRLQPRGRRYPVLDDAETAFVRLADRLGAPRLCTPLGLLSLSAVRALLLDVGTPLDVRDAVWRVLSEKARAEGGVWLLAAVGCALPKLRSMAWHATRTPGVDRDEVCQELLAAFSHALVRTDPLPEADVLGEFARLARNAGQAVADRVRAAQRRQVPLGAAEPSRPLGHPDFVLAELVRSGVIDRTEADLIGRHRLEGVPLRAIAAERGWYPMQATRMLRAAEGRVVAALASAG